MKRRFRTVAIISSLALTSTILLAGCGGGSTATTSPTAVASASSSAFVFDPPRPVGIADSEWPAMVADIDPSGIRARFAERTPEENSEKCQTPYAPLSADKIVLAGLIEQFPGSTVEEWTALLEYTNEANEAYGIEAVRAELCAALPPMASSPADAPLAEPAAAGPTGVVCDGTDAPCALGDTGPGGGIVFAVSDVPFACGDGYECTTLEVAPVGWNGSDTDPWTSLCPASVKLDGTYLMTDTVEGSGWDNTNKFETACGADSAAGIASGYEGGGMNDWYLPSKDELDNLIENKEFAGGFATDNAYWSSSQLSADFYEDANEGARWAWWRASAFTDSESGTYGGSLLEVTNYVRPIRAF